MIWQRYFGDAAYSGKCRSFDAAKEYAEDLLRKYGPPVRKPRSNTGVLGVSRCFELFNRGRYAGLEMPYLSTTARGPKDHKRQLHRFYIHKYPTEKHALSEAIAWRQSVLQQKA